MAVAEDAPSEQGRLRAPSLFMMLAEARSVFELNSSLLLSPLLMRAPRGDGSSREAQITFVEDRPGHDRRYAIDSGKIRRELGWAPTVSFREGLTQTVDWYLANSDWVRRVQDRGYKGERLGRRR